MLTVDQLVENARIAQKAVKHYSQEQIDEVCLAVAWSVYNDTNVDILSRMAVEETSFGNYESKVIKHKRKVGGVIADVIGEKSVGLIEKNPETGISKYAKPVGVVCAILPATNPTATPASNVISILKGRNAVIFKPAPRAAECSKKAIDYMREALKKVGAPVDLIQCAEGIDIPGTNLLMQKCDLIVATGGAAMVKAAYSSGTPSYGVGVGNAVAIVAEDADVQQAATMITNSKIFDNATSCSSENSVIIYSSLYKTMIEELKKNGGYLCSAAEREILQKTLWVINDKGKQVVNPEVVAHSAQDIAKLAGIKIPAEAKMIMVEGTYPAHEDIFSQEKLCPVLTLYHYDTFDQALDMYTRITLRCGIGHSVGIHTFKSEYIERMGETLDTSRVTVRQPMAAANGGHAANRMPSTTTLGCGTWGKNSTTENINYKHFLNITWVNEPVAPREFSEDKIWGDYWKKYGK